MSTNFARPFACPKVLRILLLAGSAAAALTGLSVHAQQRGGQTLETAPVPSTPIAGDFSLAAVGDLIYLRPMLATLEKQAPEMLRILRGADVTFGNFETTALDLATFKGSPQAESGGTWMLADPGVPKDVAAMGVDIVGHANNHATDWGVEGMIETLKLLDAAKLVRAGTGRTMAEARAPAYYDGPQGRVALVSATTTFTPMTPAADPLGRVPGRPGANTIRSTEIGQVSEADLTVLARITGTKPGAPVRIKGRDFRAVDAPTTPMTIGYDLNQKDLAANLLAVRQARQNGNFVVFSLHNHEPGNASQTPADFAPGLARQIIDAGADVNAKNAIHDSAYLLAGARGYRDILAVSEPLDGTSSRLERVQAFGASISRRPGMRQQVLEISAGLPGQLASFLAHSGHGPQAIFTFNGVATLAVTRALLEAGRNLVADVGLIALDDLDWYPLVGKGITALAQPTERIGVAAFESLLGRLRGDSGAARRIDFKANLIIRGSTQPQ